MNISMPVGVTVWMKSTAVHTFMRKHFLPFLYEHGLVRPMVPVTGMAITNHAGFHIRLGYKLGVGFHDWTGNDLRLEGTIMDFRLVGQRSLHADALQPDDLFPTTLRAALRTIGIQQLSKIVATARTSGRELPDYVLAPLRQANVDHLYVPDFRYQTENDQKWWCGTVRPHLPDCIGALKSEAERPRADTEDGPSPR